MKNHLPLFILLTLLFLSFTAISQQGEQLSRIKIYSTPNGLKKIREAGIDFDHGHYDIESSTFINEFLHSDVLKIKQLGFRVDVLVEDVFAYTDSLNRVEDPYKYANEPVNIGDRFNHLRLNFTTSNQPYETYISTPSSFVLGSMGGFYNLAELESQIDNMVATYPSLVTKTSIGNTLQGRPIWVVKISDNASVDESEGEVLYTGMHHSREGMSMMNLIFFMRFLLENYSTNAMVKDLVDHRELFFIPVVNIDGFNYNTTSANWSAGRRMRRKNMAETTTNSINSDGSGGDGVDINRNYGTYWGSSYSNGNTASSGTGSSDAYRGGAAFSEPETQRMRDFVNSRNFKIALNYHCYGNWWIRPQGPDSTVYSGITLPAASVGTYGSLAALFTQYNCYVYGTPLQTVYDVNGYSDDWLFSDPSHDPVYSFSPEIGSSADGFWCPQAKIIPYAKETIFSNLQAAYSVGGYAELQDNSDISLNSLTCTFDFTVTRRGLTDAPVTVTMVPLNNIQTVGSSFSAASIANFNGAVNGSISYTLPNSITPGTVVRFVAQLVVDGITIRDTIIKIYSPTIVFSDNMDNSANFNTKWIRSGTGSAWAYASGRGVSATASLTESPSGNYSNSADHVISLANPLDLSSASQAYLSYMIKYGTENCMDRLQVEISTTGVNGTYSPIFTSQTIKESRGSLGGNPALTGSTDGWVRDLVNLNSYIGNNNVGLRFRFLSSSGNRQAYSTEGFDIDNLSVVKTNAFILPVNFEDIVANRAGESVMIKWKATPTVDFSHYEVLRSSDGRDFMNIGTLYNNAATSFYDHSPMAGKNFYRLKAVDKSGSHRLSKTVLIVFEPSTSLTIFPNPVKEMINLEITSDKARTAIVEIATLEGQVVYSRNVFLKAGINRSQIQADMLSSQLYVVKIKNEARNVIVSTKILKSN